MARSDRSGNANREEPIATRVGRAVSDLEVLRTSAREKRVLITHDKHFGRLIYREGKPIPAGVVYIPPDTWGLTNVSDIVLALIEQEAISIEGFYVTVERGIVRRRPLPSPPDRTVPAPPPPPPPAGIRWQTDRRRRRRKR